MFKGDFQPFVDLQVIIMRMGFLLLLLYRSKPCLAVVPWKSPDDRLSLSTGRKQVDGVK